MGAQVLIRIAFKWVTDFPWRWSLLSISSALWDHAQYKKLCKFYKDSHILQYYNRTRYTGQHIFTHQTFCSVFITSGLTRPISVDRFVKSWSISPKKQYISNHQSASAVNLAICIFNNGFEFKCKNISKTCLKEGNNELLSRKKLETGEMKNTDRVKTRRKLTLSRLIGSAEAY